MLKTLEYLTQTVDLESVQKAIVRNNDDVMNADDDDNALEEGGREPYHGNK